MVAHSPHTFQSFWCSSILNRSLLVDFLTFEAGDRSCLTIWSEKAARILPFDWLVTRCSGLCLAILKILTIVSKTWNWTCTRFVSRYMLILLWHGLARKCLIWLLRDDLLWLKRVVEHAKLVLIVHFNHLLRWIDKGLNYVLGVMTRLQSHNIRKTLIVHVRCLQGSRNGTLSNSFGLAGFHHTFNLVLCHILVVHPERHF